MERNPIKNDRREARRKNRKCDREGWVGCTLCGRSADQILEGHHVAGRKIDPELIAQLCQGDHPCVQEGLRQMGLEDHHPADAIERAVGRFLGVADFAAHLNRSFKRAARELLEFLGDLDHCMPHWEKELQDNE